MSKSCTSAGFGSTLPSALPVGIVASVRPKCAAGPISSPDAEHSAVRSQQAPRICLLGASFSTENRGVAALAAGAISAALHAFPYGTVFLLDYSRTPSRHRVHHQDGEAEIELVNLRFSKRFWLPNNIARLLLAALFYRLLPSQGLKTRFVSANPVLNQILEADLVGSIAGGDSFSDIYGIVRLVYVSLPQLLAIVLGKPLVLLPQTLGPFKGFFARRLAAFIMRRAQVVYARDRESLVEAQPLLGSKGQTLRHAYDLAFALEPLQPSTLRPEAVVALESRPLVGLNVSGLLWMGGYNRNNMFGLNCNYQELVRGIIRYFLERDVHVLLVPHVFGDGPDSESDTIAARKIHHEFESSCRGRLHCLEGEFDQHEIKYVIGRCDFFLGSRMHACIAGLSQCVPSVGLAYSRKFDGVLRSIGAGDLVIDLARHNAEEVIQRIDLLFARREELRERLRSTMPQVKASVLNLFSGLLEKPPDSVA